LVERAAVRLDHAGDLGPQRFDLGDVDADAGAAVGRGPVDHLEDAPRPGDDHRQPRLVEFVCLARARRALARGRIEDFEIARDRVAAVARLDGARIGGVHPGEPAGGVARPYRRGQRLEQPPDRVDVAAQLLVVGGELGQLALRAGQVLDAQHRAPADGAALDREVAVLQRCEHLGEAPAFLAQRHDRALDRLRLVGLEPGPEGKHAARQRRADRDRDVAGDFRLIGAGRPHHDDLRLGMQQRVGAVALLAQRVDLGLSRRQRMPGAHTRAQQRDRGDHAEQDDAEAQHQRRRLVPVERRDCGEIVGDQWQPLLFGPCRIGQQRREGGHLESPARRMRVPAPSPDRLRHFRAPARQQSRPGHGPATSLDA
jgi:hypothetical protein